MLKCMSCVLIATRLHLVIDADIILPSYSRLEAMKRKNQSRTPLERVSTAERDLAQRIGSAPRSLQAAIGGLPPAPVKRLRWAQFVA